MMGLREKSNSLSPHDLLGNHQRTLILKHLAAQFEAIGFEVSERFGYFVKIVPNSMMFSCKHDLIKALTNISSPLPSDMLANVGLIATK